MKIRTEAVSHLNHFCENFLSQYSKSRNFDFGKDKRDNTSCLSKYITHRVIDELEVIKSAHSKYPYLTIEKFIQEVFLANILERLVRITSEGLASLQARFNKIRGREKKYKLSNMQFMEGQRLNV